MLANVSVPADVDSIVGNTLGAVQTPPAVAARATSAPQVYLPGEPKQIAPTVQPPVVPEAAAQAPVPAPGVPKAAVSAVPKAVTPAPVLPKASVPFKLIPAAPAPLPALINSAANEP